MIKATYFLLALTLFFYCPSNLTAQSSETQDVITGSVGFDYQYYTIKNTNGTSPQRQPTHYARFLANVNLKVNDDFNIPFILRLGNSFATPLNPTPAAGQNFIDYLLNPQNYIYAAPTYKNFKVELGSQIPYLSKLTAGDIQMMGVGASIRTGNFTVQVKYGITQRPVEGLAYKETMGSARFQFAMGEKNHKLGLNIVHIMDRTSSVTATPFAPPSMQAVVSVDLKLKLGKNVIATLEGANSAIAPNTATTGGSSEKSASSWLIPQKYLITSGYAAEASLKFKKKKGGFNLSGSWKDEDFIQLGFPFNSGDRLEAMISPHLNLANNKVFIKSRFGVLINNFSTKGSAGWTLSPLVNINVYTTPTEYLSITTNYSNFGITNTIEDNTMKIKMITHSIMVSPTLSKKMWGLNNKLTVGFTYDRFNDYNPTTEMFSDRKSHNKWITLGTGDEMWSASTTFSSVANKFGGFTTTVNSLSLNGSANFLENRIKPFGSLTFGMPRAGGSKAAKKTILSFWACK